MLCSILDTIRTAASVAILASALPFASAICYDYGYPPPGAVCNVSPDSNSYLAILEIVAEDTPGQCQAADAPFGGEYYEKARIVYTGVDNIISTVSALNTVSDVTPTLTGTYTFSYNVPHTSILDGSPITVNIIYSIPGFGDFATSTSSWIETHVPTAIYTVSTSTSTTPFQVFTQTTITSTSTSTSTVTPAVVQSTVVTGTSTIKAPTPTTQITRTITPKPRTVYKYKYITSTATSTCYKGKAHLQRLRARDAPVYAVPDCDPITVSTIYTSTSIVFEASTTTVTDTDYTTVTSTSTTTLVAVTSYISVAVFTTITPPACTETIYRKAARPTITRTITFTIVSAYFPLGRKTPCCASKVYRNPRPTAYHTCPFPFIHKQS